MTRLCRLVLIQVARYLANHFTQVHLAHHVLFVLHHEPALIVLFVVSVCFPVSLVEGLYAVVLFHASVDLLLDVALFLCELLPLQLVQLEIALRILVEGQATLAYLSVESVLDHLQHPVVGHLCRFLQNKHVVCLLRDFSGTKDTSRGQHGVILHFLGMHNQTNVDVKLSGEFPQHGRHFVLQVKLLIALCLVR